ncbi:hypothetical protein [Glaciihabitans sp. UYNi722]|uniref:hypothetical protein n=1 Tax=Glaciihabitans sp. UYNi722 TaxID=3156344 RepID=UPI003398FE48
MPRTTSCTTVPALSVLRAQSAPDPREASLKILEFLSLRLRGNGAVVDAAGGVRGHGDTLSGSL